MIGAVAAALGRLLLLAYPSSFRRDVGPDVVADIRRGAEDRARSEGRVRALGWVLRNAGSLVAGAVGEWRSGPGGPRGARRDAGDWIREIRRSARTLARDRAFSGTVVVTLTLGIAMTTAVFSVVDGVLLRPLPYPAADDVVMVWQTDQAVGIQRDDVAVGNYLDWRDRTSSFDGFAALEPWGLEFLTESGPEEIEAWRVTEEFFSVLRTTPLLGRPLTPEDFEGIPAGYEGTGGVAVVSHAFWQRRLGGDPGIVGRTIQLDDEPVEVAGVMPPEFDMPRGNAIWIPRVFTEAERRNRVANYYQVVARLADGVGLEAAQADLDRAAAQMAGEYPSTNESIGASAVLLPELVLGPVRSGLLLLLGCSGFLLAIACTNVASLVIARTSDRTSQLGMRAAMGARRRDLVLPQVLECVLLALGAAAISGLLVVWTLGGLKNLAPATLPRLSEVSVDLRVWAFALLVALAVSILVGLPAAARAGRVDLTELLKGSGRRATGDRGSRSRRETLVTVQLAMALVLVTGASLTARSVMAVAALDLGYRTDNVAVVTSQIWRHYPDGPAQTAFVRESLERLGAVPGVRDVGITSGLPLAPQAFADEATFFVESEGAPVEGRESSASAATVTPGYFDALGIPLLAGRSFGPRDGPDAAPVVIVNEELARRHWPGVSAVGERLTVTFAGPPRSMEVVGLVGNVRFAALDQDPGPRLYIPHPQSPNGALHFVARTSVDPATLIESIKRELWEVNSALSIGDSYAFRELRADAERERRFYAFLLVAFAATALAIAAVGLYGLGAYTVARQRSEIGIMLALGATPGRIARLFVARGGRLLGIGLALGLLAALGLTRFLRGLLFGLSPTDPLTLALSIAGLGGIGLLAMWVPARRASRLDPTEALRTD